MIGWDNEDISFVFELTYNYGISKYERGNDLNCILFHKFNKNGEDMEKKLLKSEFCQGLDCQEGEVMRLVNDDFLFKFENSNASSNQLVKGLTLNSTDVTKTTEFYQTVGFTLSQASDYLYCEGYDYFRLYLKPVQSIERGEAFGRLAVSCADEDVEKVYAESEATALNKPITLKTEGKADVVVTILMSPDSQEHCFVNDTGFKDLS